MGEPMSSGLILHITTREAWEEAKRLGRYEAPSLASQGYIHCSLPDQVLRVADGLFRGQARLVLLGVDLDRLSSPVRYENCEGGPSLFPHVYGPINVDAVVEVWDFQPNERGEFRLPTGVDVGGKPVRGPGTEADRFRMELVKDATGWCLATLRSCRQRRTRGQTRRSACWAAAGAG
jgi:uncharacterized protein (DUF952 family)